MENVAGLFAALKQPPQRDLTEQGIEPNPGPFTEIVVQSEASDEPL
jgi:hypothetical protein